MLPKIAIPSFETELPSTGEKILYRPFLVKEEKILLIAKQGGERSEILLAIREILSACILNEDFDVNKITLFDMEYLFIKLRTISVGNIIEFSVMDSTDNQTYNFEMNLEDVKIQFPENQEKKIMLDDNLGIVMKYPTMDLSDKLSDVDEVLDFAFETIKNCIDYVFDKDEIYDWKISSEEEKNEFLDSLSQKQYQAIVDFFHNIPKLEHIFEYTNSLGEAKKVYFRSIEDFFLLG